MYLRELPESLFSNDLVEEFSKLAMRYRSLETGVDEYKEQMKRLLAELPVWNYQTMKRIVYHLNKVHQHEANNRMDASNLAIVFSMSFIDQENLSVVWAQFWVAFKRFFSTSSGIQMNSFRDGRIALVF